MCCSTCVKVWVCSLMATSGRFKTFPEAAGSFCQVSCSMESYAFCTSCMPKAAAHWQLHDSAALGHQLRGGFQGDLSTDELVPKGCHSFPVMKRAGTVNARTQIKGT